MLLGANLSGANLVNANFEGAMLLGAQVDEALIDGANFKNGAFLYIKIKLMRRVGSPELFLKH